MNQWLPVPMRATMWAYLPIRAQNGEDSYNDNVTRLRNHRRCSGLGKTVFREALSLYCPWAIKYYHSIWGLTFHYRGLECQSRKSRNTRSNRQICPWVQNEAGQRLIELCQENALVIANTFFQQHKRRLYTWTSPDGQYQNQIDYILCSQRWRSSIQSAKTRLGADCGSDHELLIAKFRLKWKQVGT